MTPSAAFLIPFVRRRMGFPVWQGPRLEGRKPEWEHPAQEASQRNIATTAKNKPQ